jgi:hypothetical protein
MLAENSIRAADGYKKSVESSEQKLLGLRRHRTTMVQAAESRKGLNLAFRLRASCYSATCWRVLRKSEMSPVLVVVEEVCRHQPFEVPFIQE